MKSITTSLVISSSEVNGIKIQKIILDRHTCFKIIKNRNLLLKIWKSRLRSLFEFGCLKCNNFWSFWFAESDLLIIVKVQKLKTLKKNHWCYFKCHIVIWSLIILFFSNWLLPVIAQYFFCRFVDVDKKKGH